MITINKKGIDVPLGEKINYHGVVLQAVEDTIYCCDCSNCDLIECERELMCCDRL